MKKGNKVIKVFRYFSLLLVIAIGLVSIIGTGGGGGGGSGGGSGTTPLATGTFIKTIDPTDNIFWSPQYFSNTTYHSQNLYPASDINGSGNIASISFEYAALEAADITCADVTIKMGHTTSGSLVTTFADNVEQGAGSVQTVLANASIVFPAGLEDDWIEIPLDTPFYYNGVDNLVVDITTNVVCSGDFHTDITAALGYTGIVYDSDINAATAGSSGPFRADMEFHFEGGDNLLFSNPTGSATAPFGDNPLVQRQQQLYIASDINGSGPITGLGIQVGNLTSEETYTVSVNLGHATVTTLALDYAANYSDSPVAVANSVSFTVPANVPANSYVWIPLPDAVFTYNGTDNLIVEFHVTAATGATEYTHHNHGSGDVRLIFGTSNGALIMPNATIIPHIKLRFNGGTMDVITAENTASNVPFLNGHDYKTQIMFGTQQLGTGGPVTGISFRLAYGSVASDYPAATVVLGHTANTVLSKIFADNLTDPTTVFTGTLNVPAGLKAGDWVTTTVSGFTYDSTQNLVVEVTLDAGTANNLILATDVDVPGASGMVTGPRVDPVAIAESDGQSDIRVHLNK